MEKKMEATISGAGLLRFLGLEVRLVGGPYECRKAKWAWDCVLLIFRFQALGPGRRTFSGIPLDVELAPQIQELVSLLQITFAISNLKVL